MKIAISAERADLTSDVAHRFGLSPYLLVVDTETMDFKALANPSATSRTGAGVRAVVFAISEGVEVVLTGYCSPTVYNQLASNVIKVVTNVSGMVKEVIEKYKSGGFGQGLAVEGKKSKQPVTSIGNIWSALSYTVIEPVWNNSALSDKLRDNTELMSQF